MFSDRFWDLRQPRGRSAGDQGAVVAALRGKGRTSQRRLAAYEAALQADHTTYEAYIYPGTHHGFYNDSTPRYDEAAAKLAWERTLGWFGKYLV